MVSGMSDLFVGRRHHGPGVYFIAAGPEMKIGHSADPAGRLGALQTAASQELLLIHTIIEPDKERRRRLEDELHTRFAEHHVRGEWFVFGAVYNYAYDRCRQECQGRPPLASFIDRLIRENRNE
jgi:hypothetical protein